MNFAVAPLPAMPALNEYFGDKIEQRARAFAFPMTAIDTGTAEFKDIKVSVDPSFIEMFRFEVLAGSLEDTLANITNIALSEKTAWRYFGNQDPIGKVITIGLRDFKEDLKVTAVYRIPGNTVLEDIHLLGLLNEKILPPALTHWFSPSSAHI